jgi:PAS domain S-box-containing protein
MDFSFLKKWLVPQREAIDLHEMRVLLLDILLPISAVIGTGIYFVALRPALAKGLYVFAAFYTVAYIWLLLITVGKRLSYRLRTNSWLFFLYFFGVVNLPLSGFNVDSGLFFLTFIAMTTLLYHLRAGLVALLLSLASIGVMGYAIAFQNFRLYLGLPQNNIMLWLVGGTIFLLMGCILALSLNGLLQGLAVHLDRARNLTEELRLKNEALAESETRYRRLVDTSPDSILLVDLDGKIMMANLASQVLLGFTSAEEMVGWEIRDLMPGDPLGDRGGLGNQLASGAVRGVETEMLRKDGRHIMVEFSASPVLNAAGEPQAILGIGRDVTKRKIAEWLLHKAKDRLEQQTGQLQTSQMQLRKLAGQVITIHEEERRIIAQELHDDVGQTLVTLNHGLSSALDELPEEAGPLRERLAGSLKLVERAMTLIRSVSHRLRPPALAAGGLNLSLAELCRECREQTGLQIQYKGQELPGLPEDIAINLYRVAQEAITNVLKHARASSVKMKLSYRRDTISLSIVDNGKTSLVKIQDHAGGTGLFGMQERLSLLGGELKVDPNRERGYRLTARVPWYTPGSHRSASNLRAGQVTGRSDAARSAEDTRPLTGSRAGKEGGENHGGK